MRFLALMLIAVCAGNAGCGPNYYWHNPAKSLTEAKRDCLQCGKLSLNEASEAVAEDYYGGSTRYYNSSTTARGFYGHQIDPDGPDHSAIQGWTTWGTMYRENVFRGCMNRKGYQLVREGELSRLVRRRDLGIYGVAGR